MNKLKITDETTLQYRIRRIAGRISASYATILRIPTSSSGIEYARLGYWCDLHNISLGGITAQAVVLALIVRKNYGSLAHAYPQHSLSKHFEKVDACLKVIETVARILNEQ